MTPRPFYRQGFSTSRVCDRSVAVRTDRYARATGRRGHTRPTPQHSIRIQYRNAITNCAAGLIVLSTSFIPALR